MHRMWFEIVWVFGTLHQWRWWVYLFGILAAGGDEVARATACVWGICQWGWGVPNCVPWSLWRVSSYCCVCVSIVDHGHSWQVGLGWTWVDRYSWVTFQCICAFCCAANSIPYLEKWGTFCWSFGGLVWPRVNEDHGTSSHMLLPGMGSSL